MKFSIHQNALNDTLSVVAKAVSLRTVNPILAGIFIEAQENEVIFRATDLELSIQATSPALIEEDGKALLPAKLLNDIVSTLPDEAVNFEVSNEKAEISCANSNFSIRTLNSTDYPDFPKVETKEKVNLPYLEFSKMTKRVAKMTSKDDSRPILQGVNVKVAGNKLELIATDAYRIAVAKQEISTDNTSQFSAVIPGEFLINVASMKGDIDNAIISLSENQVVVECSDFVFINRRIAGNFPDYEQLIPQQSAIKAKIKVKELTNCIKRIDVLSSISQSVTMTFDPLNSCIDLSGSATDVGTCEERILTEYESGSEKIKIAFNCAYVLEGLACFNSDEIICEIIADNKPGIFKQDNNIIYILLPVRLS